MPEPPTSGWRRTIWNVLTNWASFVISVGTSLLLSPYIVHTLGDVTYGAWVLLDALLEDDSTIPFIQVFHEQSAVHIADGYYRASGKVMAAITSIGPGATNTIIGLATSFADSTSLLLLTGGPATHMRGHGTMQELDRYQDNDFRRVVEPVTKRHWDINRVEGASMLAAPLHALMAAGLWADARGTNLFDPGAPFYDTYATTDGRHVAVGCLEPRFFAEFAGLLPLDERFVRGQYDRTLWPEMRVAIAGRIARKTRDEWDAVFAETNACVAPVLSLHEARDHPHNRARNAFVSVGKFDRPAPTPRFSKTQSTLAAMPTDDDRHPATVLARFGIGQDDIAAFVKSGVIG